MICSKRVSVIFSLVAYLLATAGVNALHDHSSHSHHCGGTCKIGAAAEDGNEDCCPQDADGELNHSHRHPTGSKSCDESCFACRLLAVKGVAATTLVVIPSIAAVCPVEQPSRSFFPLQRPTQPLSRGPPCC